MAKAPVLFNRTNLVPFNINNLGIYFYLCGSLLFFLGDMRRNRIPNVHAGVLLATIVVGAMLLFRLMARGGGGGGSVTR